MDLDACKQHFRLVYNGEWEKTRSKTKTLLPFLAPLREKEQELLSAINE